MDYTAYDPSATLQELQQLYKAQLREATKRFRSARSAQKELDIFRQTERYLRRLSASDYQDRGALLARTRHLREFLRDKLTTRRGYDDYSREIKRIEDKYGLILDYYDPDRRKSLNVVLNQLNDQIRLMVFNSKIPSEERNIAIRMIYEEVTNVDTVLVEVSPGIYRKQRKINIDLTKYISDLTDEMEDRWVKEGHILEQSKGRLMP